MKKLLKKTNNGLEINYMKKKNFALPLEKIIIYVNIDFNNKIPRIN